MSDSTPYLDANGIRRDAPTGPRRHPLPADAWPFLGLIARLGAPGSAERIGWEHLVRVHSFAAVVRAAARCFHRVDRTGLVSSDQAQAVLDGKPPRGREVNRHASGMQRARAAG